MNFQKNIWYSLFWIQFIIIFFYWFQGSESLWELGIPGVFVAVGRLAGLIATYLILLQFFLMSRFTLLERVFGLDRLSRFHQKNGKIALGVLLLHPLFLMLGYADISGMDYWTQFTLFFADLGSIFLALLGLCLLLVVVGSALYIIRSKVKYEWWYFVHLLAYLAVLFPILHQFELGSTLLGSDIFYGYWMTMYIIVLVVHIIFRIARPLYVSHKHQFRVGRIVRETPDTVSIYFTGRNLESFSARPGQFMIVRFLTKGMWWQAHPFSVSAIPDGKEIRITVKELGDFTSQLQSVALGVRVIIDGPFGVFTNLFSISSKVLMIAGGIGITPIRSLMEEMLREKKDVVLLYANRDENSVVFKKELDALEKQYNVKVVHVMSHQESYRGEKGYIDEEKICRIVPDISDREVYLCGPVPMMNSLIPVLNRLVGSKLKIHFEKFSF